MRFPFVPPGYAIEIFCCAFEVLLPNHYSNHQPIKHMKKRSSFPSPSIIITVVSVLFRTISGHGAPPLVKGVEAQPLAAQIDRLFEAMDYLGSPVSAETKATFDKLKQEKDGENAVEGV